MQDTFYERAIALDDAVNTGDWEVSRAGVTRERQVKGGKNPVFVNESASPIPIWPTAVVENLDSGVEKLELSFYKNQRWKTVLSDRSVVANRSQIIRLADRGVEVNSENAGLLVRYIADTVALSLDALPHRQAKSVMGWAGDDFMPFTGAMVFDGEETHRQLYRSIHAKGTLGEWIAHVAPLRENIPLRLCMAASFASPLIERAGENPFVFHLWGGTGVAKTVALLVAMSIWGDPAVGRMTRTMNMTQNAMLSTAAFLNSIPFAGDELQTIKSVWTNYDRLIMSITEGIDRGRMSFDQVRDTRTWRCSFLFTGEEPCTKSASGGGVKNRVIEIECQEKLVPNGNLTANFVRTHYGQAAKPFVEVAAACDVAALYTPLFREILQSVDTTDKQAGAMALMLTADRLASRLFFPGERELAVDDVRPYLRSAREVDNAERAYAYLVDTVAQNAPRFTPESREIWGRIDDGVVLFNKSVLETVLEEKGFDFEAVKSRWAERGYLLRNSQGRFLHQTRVYGIRAGYVRLALEIPPEEAVAELQAAARHFS